MQFSVPVHWRFSTSGSAKDESHPVCSPNDPLPNHMTTNKKQPIEALVLDFGGVISRTLFETHHLTERALGLPPGTLKWRGPFDPATDPLWRDMQADRITERDYWTARTHEVGGLLGEQWSEMQTF